MVRFEADPCFARSPPDASCSPPQGPEQESFEHAPGGTLRGIAELGRPVSGFRRADRDRSWHVVEHVRRPFEVADWARSMIPDSELMHAGEAFCHVVDLKLG